MRRPTSPTISSAAVVGRLWDAQHPMHTANWQTILIYIAIIVGVLVGPYEMLLVLQRIWEQRRRARIARGEDVRPKKLPWDEED
jgi:hypothetical protein